MLKALAPPTFSANSYNIPVQENARVGDTVTTVKAKYADPKAFLKYSFLSGNKDNSFCINKDGRITVARPLDREKVSSYTLKVQVARGNDKATTTVTVVVKDINDDSPVFEKTVYVFKVKENAGKRDKDCVCLLFSSSVRFCSLRFLSSLHFSSVLLLSVSWRLKSLIKNPHSRF